MTEQPPTPENPQAPQTPGTTPPPEQPAAPVTPPAPAPAAPAAPATPAAAAPAPAAAAPAAPAAPATQPAAPVMPPPPPAYGATPPGATQPPGGYYKSGKGKTIGLIVAGVVAVGALGGIVGLVAGGGDSTTAPSPKQQPQAGSGVLNPAPVGSTDPATPTGSAEPTTEPAPTESPSPTEVETSAAPAPTPTPEPPPPSGDTVTLANGVQVVVPAGWTVQGSDDTQVAMGDGDSNFVYAVVGQVKPSADAGSVLSKSLENVLPPDLYTQLQTSDIYAGTPYGSVTSIASIDYTAIWADPQAAIPLYGRLITVVRQDGTALIITAEHTPPETFEDALDQLAEVVDPTLTAFGS